MPRSGEASRTAILDAAESLIIDHGFAGSSVDRIIKRAGLTKGAFFHHFASKAHLANALLERFVARDTEMLEQILAKAERLSTDPAQRLLIYLGLFAELLDELNADSPICMFAAYTFQRMEYPETTAVNVRTAFNNMRDLMLPLYSAALNSSDSDINPVDLIDHSLAIFEGAFVVLTVQRDPTLVGRHLRLHRDMVAKILNV